MYLAIDPGLSTGWAKLDAAGQLVACGKGEDFPILSNREAMIECPQVYQKRFQKKKVDPNNLITLAVRVGRYQERLEHGGVVTSLVLPTTWKGQVPKHIHHNQVEATLIAAEKSLMAKWPKATPTNDRTAGADVWDAVALVKWAFLFKWSRVTRTV